jgi:AraC family transcriptional regulator, regulatory protein of adaptative response / DNA-3-methyladenine glycosylase II
MCTVRWDEQELYEVFTARDASWNGRFLTGVLTTGIYCLPSCAARKPRRENVRFFASQEEARAAGLRPCRRCRPDLFYEGRDLDLERLEGLLEEAGREPAHFPDAASLAAASGFGVTKLAELTRRHYHATPLAVLQRLRVSWAAERLLCGPERVLDVGFAAGWESPSAFHASFARLTGLSPGGYRKLRTADDFILRLPPWYRVADTLAFLGRDPESPTERVRGSSASRALCLANGPARAQVELVAGHAHCRIEAQRTLSARERAEAHATLVRWLAIDGVATPGRGAAGRAPWKRLLARRPGLRIPRTPTVFEGLTWAIVGQQVNLSFAYRLRRRVVELVGEHLDPWLICHPTPKRLATLDTHDLARLQLSRRKAEYLLGAARSATDGLDLEALPRGAASRAAERLASLRGVGPWTVQYVLMRACGFADCVPAADAGLARAAQAFFNLDRRPDGAEIQRLLTPFAPHRSLATFHLWSLLGDPA